MISPSLSLAFWFNTTQAAGTFPASSSGNLPIQHIVSGILPKKKKNESVSPLLEHGFRLPLRRTGVARFAYRLRLSPGLRSRCAN